MADIVITYGGLGNVIAQSGSNVIGNIIYGAASFAVMVIILAIGYIVASLLGRMLKEFFNQVKVEKFMENHDVHDSLMGFTVSGITITLVKFWVMVTFLGIAAEITSVGLLLDLSRMAINYLPSLIEGVAILVFGLVAGDYVTDKLKTMKKIPFVNGIAMALEVFIIYNAAVIALPLILPTASASMLESSFNIILAAFCFSIGLGFAIAIGLGLKEAVSEVAKKNKDKIAKMF